MKTRLIAPFLVVVALAAACSGSSDDRGDGPAATTSTTTATKGPAKTPPADCDGSVESPDPRFIVDSCGRVIILRGVNVQSGSKGGKQSDVHLPKVKLSDQSLVQSEWGWNTVRFLVFWGAIEPEKGTYDEAYLDEVQKWVDWYGERGIHVVLDMHQDLYGWKVNGNGAPDWAVDTKGVEVTKLEDGMPWYLQGVDPAVQNAYQSFWNPEDGDTMLQDHYLGSLTHLVKRFKDHPAVIGYDVMNEPSFANGDLNATVAIQDKAAKGEFHNTNLTNFMNKGIKAVRDGSDDAYVFIEPTSLINAFPYPGDLLEDQIVDPRAGAPRVVYAGHLYEPEVHDGHGYGTDSVYVDTWAKYRAPEAETMKAALWFGEWGGSSDQPRMNDYITDVTNMADEQMAGWSWWSWDPGGWAPVEKDGTTISANGKALRRVQPQAVAGTPTKFAWDTKTKTFTMTWDERAEAKGDTELAVPKALFGSGIEVRLDGKAVTDPAWDQATSTLTIAADRSARTHQVCVAPAGSGACD